MGGRGRHRLMALAAAWLLGGCEAPSAPPAPTADALVEGVALVATGVAPGALRLPDDHAAHPRQGGELWRLQAKLEVAGDRPQLFTLGIVRLNLGRPSRPQSSAWSSDALLWGWSARLGPDGPGLAQRRARATLGLAGAALSPARVWVRDWGLALGPGRPPWRLVFEDAEGTRLVLGGSRPALGLARLGETLGVEATTAGLQGYLLSGLTVAGRLVVAGRARPVTGQAWFEHLWGGGEGGTGAGAGLRLTRLTLQLDDARTLACVELRRAEAGGRPIPGCVLVDAAAQVHRFRRRELRLEPLEGGARPARWRLEIPAVALAVELTPWDDALETIAPGVAVRVAGRAEGRVIEGWGWVESIGPGQRRRGEGE
ncbi:carotenoid 1,2-hydratase [Marichromatium bheemlicum]|uniref:Carotenoid 1,2-hydratase n=1 Tax=Marichromatium bheemlicum TaxID=365339 RepID=A0ABX1I7R9_9GAMM|nr:carotenoid 1,2-hydratase [Marichromatium bheemlicum]NKN33557.1 carotenoid 1,2-hydratase [Marichromatium bheemlicum]